MNEIIGYIDALHGTLERFQIEKVAPDDFRIRSDLIFQHFGPAYETSDSIWDLLQPFKKAPTNIARCTGQKNEWLFGF
jgi:hypothetical protein